MTTDIGKLEARALAKFVGLHGISVSGSIRPPGDIDAEARELKSLIKGTGWLAGGQVAAFDFSINGNYCVALKINISEIEIMDLIGASEGAIESIDVRGAVYLYLADQLKVNPLPNSNDWIEEHIAFPASQSDGVELDVVRAASEPVAVFQIRTEGIVRPSWPGKSKHVANFILTYHKKIISAPGLSGKAIEFIREIFLQEKLHLFDDNLFRALSSPIPRHAFLEIYRTLEFIFVLPHVRALANELELKETDDNIDLIKLARICYLKLRWKRVERDSLEQLFEEYSQRHLAAFQGLAAQCVPFKNILPALKSSDIEKSRSAVAKTAEKFYLLRNQVVHQMWRDDEINCEAADWAALGEFTLGCIKFFYESYLSGPAEIQPPLS